MKTPRKLDRFCVFILWDKTNLRKSPAGDIMRAMAKAAKKGKKAPPKKDKKGSRGKGGGGGGG